MTEPVPRSPQGLAMIDMFRNAWKMGVEAEDYDRIRDRTDACTRCKTRIPLPGNETGLGRINQLLAAVSVLETPLLRQIKKFGYTTTAVIGVGVHGVATTWALTSGHSHLGIIRKKRGPNFSDTRL